MTEAARIVDELNRAIEGDPWHGSSVSAILDGVTAKAAGTRPHPGVHTIWEIVRHMTAWTGEVLHRLHGHPPRQPIDGDWPAPSGADDKAWRADVAALLSAHERIVARIASISDADLQAPPTLHRDAPTGSGVTEYVLLHGLSQHHAYHSGQIALLKKMVSS
jgi:uncharacterized damage-inducible protein DinB